MKLRFLINPSSGTGRGGRALARAQAVAARLGCELELSRSAEDLTGRARRAREEGVERLIAVGGDGTLHHVIAGLAGGSCELAILPMGTGNDLAAAVGVPGTWDGALELALEGKAHPCDLGAMVTAGEERTFAIFCGAGLDSEVSAWVHARGKVRPAGRFAYLIATLVVLPRFRAPHMTVDFDGGRFEGRAMLAVAANGFRFGGGMRIAPEASPRDGLFDLVVVREISPWWRALHLLQKVYFGRHVHHPAVEIVRTTRARIASSRVLPVGLDGEDGGTVGPEGVEIEIRPGALRIVGFADTSDPSCRS